MAWRIEFSADADRELRKLDPPQAKRILKFLQERIAPSEDPRILGKASQGARLGEFWRYRVGLFRLICKIEDERLLVLVLRSGHREEIYR
jgi:mRNA interferase RelE/StbE